MHYPVVNKSGDIIASAVTNLDLHDIARAVKTYGVRMYYVVTPLVDQREIIRRIISHWTDGVGSWYNPQRKEALETIDLKESLEAVVEDIRAKGEGDPKTVATCARAGYHNMSYEKFREKLRSGKPYLLLFGTAWGFSADFLQDADYVLEPIKGAAEYNHLSVRSAAAVIFDRVLA